MGNVTDLFYQSHTVDRTLSVSNWLRFTGNGSNKPFLYASRYDRGGVIQLPHPFKPSRYYLPIRRQRLHPTFGKYECKSSMLCM